LLSSGSKYPVFLLVWLSQTKAKYGPLTDHLIMYPTTFGRILLHFID
jgi:hypothetical protein